MWCCASPRSPSGDLRGEDTDSSDDSDDCDTNSGNAIVARRESVLDSISNESKKGPEETTSSLARTEVRVDDDVAKEPLSSLNIHIKSQQARIDRADNFSILGNESRPSSNIQSKNEQVFLRGEDTATKRRTTRMPRDRSGSTDYEEPKSFWVSPHMVTVSTPFYAQYVRPDEGGPSVGGWIGLFKESAGPKEYVTYYNDTDANLNSSIWWAKGPPSEGKWEMRYYDKDSTLLSSQIILAKREKIHEFTRDFPASNNPQTRESRHPQCPLWPSYLPIDDSRLFVMERSKNPSLVVYYANIGRTLPPHVSYQKRCRPLPSKLLFREKEPIIVRWYSWGWTPEPELNALSTLQVPFMGATFKKVRDVDETYEGYLNALSKTTMRLCVGTDPTRKRTIPMLVGRVGDSKRAFLRKVYVKTTSSFMGPRVDYVDIYGVDLATGKPVQERLKQ